MSDELLSTGLTALDRELDGGLYPGSLVYLRADAMTMAEIFLYHFLQQAPTYYVNTERMPEFIMLNMQRLGFDTSSIRFIDVYQKYNEKEEVLLDYSREVKDYRILSYVKEQLEGIEEDGVNLIVDTVSFLLHLEVKRAMKRELFHTIYSTVKKIGRLGVLYGLKEEELSLVEMEVINLCDVVFDISMEETSDRTVTRLIVPKARDRPLHGNILKFKIEGGIILDTTKEIV
jgi:KaiC/GvpD/RAD55 family RecA-like ATPase